ncbi:MAG: cytochrome c [Bacteroidia bacterium]
MKRLKLLPVMFVSLFLITSCQKNITVPDTSAYVPTASDVTKTATLAQLSQGRSLYVNNCGRCHGLPSPDSYSASNWNIILGNMIPRTQMSASDAALVSKYVRRGN